MKISRRELSFALASGAGVTLAGCGGNAGLKDGPSAGFARLLGVNAQGGRDALLNVEGRIPDGLRGNLFRNGPGMFTRNGYTKNSLLDGDGLLQRIRFEGSSRVHYRNEFVRTSKFIEEEAAGKFLHDTWTTRAPGGFFSRLGSGTYASQAGVATYTVGNRLFALDEVAPIYELNPETLETIGEFEPGGAPLPFSNKAHTKTDPWTGEWIVAGVQPGRRQSLHMASFDRQARLIESRTLVEGIPNSYIHDFFVTQNKVIFVLHPATLDLPSFLLGSSFADALRWQPEMPNLVLVANRRGDPEPVFLEAPAAFMWHGFNAYEREDASIIADFVGYDDPVHFIGEDPQFEAIPRGRMGQSHGIGSIRRYVIDPMRQTIAEDRMNEEHHEMPMIDPAVAMNRHRYGYAAIFGGGVLKTGLKRYDFETGRSSSFDFGESVVVGEPVFAADPSSRQPDEGWLIQQGLDGVSETAFFAVFRAEAVSDGPLVIARADHPLPISFHGWWKSSA